MAAVDLSLSGLASGLDWKALVSQLAQAERTPQIRLRNEQGTLGQKNSAYTTIQTELSVLQNRVKDLSDATLFDSRQAATTDSTLATATAASGTALGSLSFNITQLATAAKRIGTSGVGAALNASDDVSGLVLSDTAFASPVTAGTITVNGQLITIATTDTLQAVFDNIQAATGSEVTGRYDSATDTIRLSSTNPIVLGSATDSSNFLQVARLNNNGTGNIASTSQLGVIKQASALSSANFATPIADGGSGTGEFKINGVSITFATTDTMSAVLKRINDSTAGVSASYDTVNDRFVLSNKTTGDIGVALEDVSGNFLEASGLSGGTISRGRNLLYSVDGGGQLISQSNTISEASSGLVGLSVTALKIGVSTVTVSADTEKTKSAISAFIAEYNKVQSIIDSQTASTTNAQGKVTAGILAGDGDADSIATNLRRMVTGQVAGLSGALKQLEDLGIASNGSDNSLKIDDESKLNKALANNLVTLKSIFTDPTNGIASKLTAFLDKTIGDSGTLIARQTNLTKQSGEIDTQIADLERIVQADTDRMNASFVAMETAQSNLKQQLAYLTKQFGASASG